MNEKKYIYISQSVVKKIESLFEENVQSIFGENLCFAFLFGGFGKGYATISHDIDMFIVVHNQPKQAVIDEFHSWYFSLHKEFNLSPDVQFPGEIIVFDYLKEKIDFLSKRRFRQIIPTYYEYEAILWGDALSEKKKGVVVKHPDFYNLVMTASKIFQEWRKDISQIYLAEYDEAYLNTLDLRRLFKKAGIKYLNKTPTAYEDEKDLL